MFIQLHLVSVWVKNRFTLVLLQQLAYYNEIYHNLYVVFFSFRRHFLHWYFNFNKITHTKNIIHWKKSLSGMTVQVMNEICEATCCDWNKALCLFVVGSWKQACNIVLLNVFYHTKSLFSKEPRYSCHYSLCRSLGHSDLACVFKKIYYIENLLCWH